MKKEGTLYTIIFIFIVSFVFVLLLSLTNQTTIERVELNEELAQQGAVLSAMGIEAETAQDIQDRYAELNADVDSGLYVGTVDGRMVYARQFSGAGLWGTISGVLAVTADLEEIIGLEIVRDNETPGLGGRINEEWFKEQFRGEDVSGGRLVVGQTPGEGDPSSSNGLVDGVTGATRTSDSIEVIINTELETLRSADVQQKLNDLRAGGNQS